MSPIYRPKNIADVARLGVYQKILAAGLVAELSSISVRVYKNALPALTIWIYDDTPFAVASMPGHNAPTWKIPMADPKFFDKLAAIAEVAVESSVKDEPTFEYTQ